ncbi:MAG: LysM peptidoglycan-binding domain-containing protein [Desulfobacteraceae bacterium]|nr:LysM peptidoglycan-binding domain-containing protein [Desulfobacteraceae bacterium]
MGHRDLIRITDTARKKACPCFDVSTFLSDNNIRETDEDITTPTGDSPMLLPETYTVKKGDTLWRISQLFGVSVDSLKHKNGLKDDTIFPDQTLQI